MANEEKSAVDQRLQNAVYGTPKINPDEQRRYLGTFRERVCLTISVAQLKERDWSDALKQELKKGIGNLVFLNGNLSDEKLRPYMRAAVQEHASFTLKTDPEFSTAPEKMAVVVAAKTAVHQSPVDVEKRYADLKTPAAPIKEPAKPSFWQRLFHSK
ncbi:YueI family protein [Limosilactobacillus mucosae]|uniref:YueI family protein n=1 Tax=Limosilactobacillus mucosae TaxID=97478 RepID=UPI003991F939